MMAGPRILYVINEAYFFVSHRLAVANAAMQMGLDVHLASPLDNVWAPDDFKTSSLASEGITHHPISLSRRGRNPVQELITIAAILRTTKIVRPEIMHLITIKPILYGGFVARLARIPALICHVTGLGQAFVETGPLAATLQAAILTGYRAIAAHPNCRMIVQNEESLEILRHRAGIPEQKLVLIRGSGVDVEEFTAKPEVAGDIRIVLPARLIWEKGVGEFVEAARRLKAMNLPVRFELVGNTHASNPRAVPETLIRDWCAEGFLEWNGRCENMPSLYARSHIVCLPSTYGEGVPKVLIEASACGRAIVASDVPGCREIVGHDVNGLLVPPNDPAALSEALVKLAQNGELRKRLGRSGREKVKEGFSVGQIVEQTMAVYRDLRP